MEEITQDSMNSTSPSYKRKKFPSMQLFLEDIDEEEITAQASNHLTANNAMGTRD
jgi:hypothetical protein